ncbi:hypothetical protein [Corynebacterium caspium]|uniref:hypothetical protein n=1 Tax=Corynebacterium caspium TaxID=234828 RepID=UPI000378C182|nr:hypothetical protein [Corynebacterium caspium]WKD58542.1 DNA polymerase III subunit epsilon [Corynebacterium caspium DSM 44850]
MEKQDNLKQQNKAANRRQNGAKNSRNRNQARAKARSNAASNANTTGAGGNSNAGSSSNGTTTVTAGTTAGTGITTATATGPRRRSRGGRRRNQAQQRPRRTRATGTPPETPLTHPEAPYVVLTLGTTGIHPGSSRIVSIDALVLAADMTTVVESYHEIINPGPDVIPGPVHMHGLSPERIGHGKSFASVLKKLGLLIDGRTLIVHDAPTTWGFIVSEGRRAMNAAARANRAKARGGNNRAENGKAAKNKQQRVGHVPVPRGIVDTLASMRRAGIFSNDIRPAAMAMELGVDTPSPVASLKRAALSEQVTSRAHTNMVAQLYRLLKDQFGPEIIASREIAELAANRAGLQLPTAMVRAHEKAATKDNPGIYQPGEELLPGMEFTVAPEVLLDPVLLVEAGVAAGLKYVEKLTRQTSLVVCNKTTDLVGKPLHAQRKNIPLINDAEFLKACQERRSVAKKPIFSS